MDSMQVFLLQICYPKISLVFDNFLKQKLADFKPNNMYSVRFANSNAGSNPVRVTI